MFPTAGAGNDLIYGNQGDDLIDGGADDDLLYGGQGADRLTGGEGDDTLFGGQGGDVFVYRSVDDDRDVIQDFDIAADQILLAGGVAISISYSTGEDSVLRLSTGTRITLIGVADPDDVAIAWG
jgi:Ca2+-binding RTX toxin-like protein